MARTPKPAAQPAPENLFGTASDADMKQVLGWLQDTMGRDRYLDYLQGQVLFYTMAAPVSADGAKAARKAQFFSAVYAAALSEE